MFDLNENEVLYFCEDDFCSSITVGGRYKRQEPEKNPDGIDGTVCELRKSKNFVNTCVF